MQLEFKLCRPGAQAPFKKYESDAGWDLFSPMAFILYPPVPMVIPLGLKLQFPKNTVGLIQGRSGLAHKHGVTTIGNVIDEDYTGEIHCCLMMSLVPPIRVGGDEDPASHYFMYQKGLRKLPIPTGTRIAQLVLLDRKEASLLQRDANYEFMETGRGEMGQGSTGS